MNLFNFYKKQKQELSFEPNIFTITQSEFCFNLNKYIDTNYCDWKKNHDKYIKDASDLYHTKAIKQLSDMYEKHKGSSITLNEPGVVIHVKNVEKWFFNKVSKSYSKILHNLNFDIYEGEFVVILGESGSGKTTLLHLLSGMERASSGQVIVANHNLVSLSEKQLTDFRKKYVSIIFQNYSLTNELTVKENVLFSYKLQQDARKRIDPDQLMDKLSILNHSNKSPSQLSGGQQQRVAIAKAICKNPTLLFADEPTGAVDKATCIEILKIFLDINQNQKTTVVLITHNRNLAKIATRVIEIKNGNIVKHIVQVPKKIEEIDLSHEK